MSTTDEQRFQLVNEPGRVGILDTKKNLFAPFLEGGYGSAASRAAAVTSALNSGDDTIAGYVWRKTP